MVSNVIGKNNKIRAVQAESAKFVWPGGPNSYQPNFSGLCTRTHWNSSDSILHRSDCCLLCQLLECKRAFLVSNSKSNKQTPEVSTLWFLGYCTTYVLMSPQIPLQLPFSFILISCRVSDCHALKIRILWNPFRSTQTLSWIVDFKELGHYLFKVCCFSCSSWSSSENKGKTIYLPWTTRLLGTDKRMFNEIL